MAILSPARLAALANLPEPAAVFQPRPGLGDLIWHLPHIRALAAQTASGRVTLIAKRSTQAEAVLAGDPAIASILWYDHNPRSPGGLAGGRHDGPGGTLRLIADLRARRLRSCVLLHHSAALAAIVLAAGIGRRHGYGYSAAQRFWLNRPPFLPEPPPFTEAFDQATAYMAAAGLADLPEASVPVPAARPALEARIAALQPPVAILGIGAHGAERNWGEARFSALATALLRQGHGSVVLLAAADEAARASCIMEEAGNPAALHAVIGWPLRDVMVLLARADLFIGNDSGLMNLRAALGRPAYALFGASGPLRHSRHIRPIIPREGARSGMRRITLGQVLETITDGVRDRP
jgi:heptosyltransferase-2